MPSLGVPCSPVRNARRNALRNRRHWAVVVRQGVRDPAANPASTTHLTLVAADSLRSPLNPRLGCATPALAGVLVLPGRAGAPDPFVRSLRAGGTRSSQPVTGTADVAPSTYFKVPATSRARRGARGLRLFRRSRGGHHSEHLARPALPTRLSVSAAAIYRRPSRRSFAVLRQTRGVTTGDPGTAAPLMTIGSSASQRQPSLSRRWSALFNRGRPHAAHSNLACSGLASLRGARP
jgi:hypothetical protein